jgi:hypothetical protein
VVHLVLCFFFDAFQQNFSCFVQRQTRNAFKFTLLFFEYSFDIYQALLRFGVASFD